MNHAQAQEELSDLLGKKVSFRRIAGNRLIIYFGGEPGDDTVTTLSIDPSWRYSKSGEWVLGSGDLPWEKEEDETEDDFSIRFNRTCDICVLTNSVVEKISLSSSSSDIEIIFSENQKIASFAGYTDEESWVYTNRLKGKRIFGSLNDYVSENTGPR